MIEKNLLVKGRRVVGRIVGGVGRLTTKTWTLLRKKKGCYSYLCKRCYMGLFSGNRELWCPSLKTKFKESCHESEG